MKEKIDNLVERAKQGPTLLRAGVAAIPWVGGSLDHLLFDKAGEVRMQNAEKAIDSMKKALENLGEEKVSKEWFESEEALDMFKNLLQKVEYEGDKEKINNLANIYCLFGTNEHKDDPNKFAVLETIAKLTKTQRIVFRAMDEVKEESKTGSSDAIQYTATAIWQSSVLEFMRKNLKYIILISGLKKPIQLDTELDILVSFNLLRLIDLPNMNDRGFAMTALGKLALSYMKELPM